MNANALVRSAGVMGMLMSMGCGSDPSIVVERLNLVGADCAPHPESPQLTAGTYDLRLGNLSASGDYSVFPTYAALEDAVQIQGARVRMTDPVGELLTFDSGWPNPAELTATTLLVRPGHPEIGQLHLIPEHYRDELMQRYDEGLRDLTVEFVPMGHTLDGEAVSGHPQVVQVTLCDGCRTVTESWARENPGLAYCGPFDNSYQVQAY